jgi:hypothetical protein
MHLACMRSLYRRVCDSAVDVAHCITTWRGIP